MKKITLAILMMLLTGCASRPYEPSTTILAPQFTVQSADTTHVKVHRAKQISGSALGESCPLILSVDNIEAVGLQQNQYIDLYLSRGQHTLKIKFSCATTAWSKSLYVNADGNYQEYEAEIGGVGQYRMWRTK